MFPINRGTAKVRIILTAFPCVISRTVAFLFDIVLNFLNPAGTPLTIHKCLFAENKKSPASEETGLLAGSLPILKYILTGQ
jgi:hypothetical protein